MKKNLLLIFFFFAFAHKLCAQWQTIYKDSANYWCTSVWFLNNDTGFVAANWLASPSFSGTIFRTLDGGLTWDTTVFYSAMYSIQFINDTVGFAGGQDGAVYRTDDMGLTWSWTNGGPCCVDLFSLHFFNLDTGFYTLSCCDILKTVNGGSGWQSVFSSLGNTSYPGRSRILFTDSLTGYITQRTITKTTDRGLTWTNLNLPFNFYACSAYFFDAINGIAVGYDGKITRTSDGGSTWSVTDSICPYPLSDIKFVNDSVGYIVGGKDNHNYSNSNGIIYKTVNGGMNWQVMDSSYFDGLLKMCFPSDSVGYAVGINGIILKLSNANSTTTVESILTKNNCVLKIYPNPVTKNLIVTFKQTKSIIITNILGEIVIEENFLFNKYGSYELDVSSLSVGVYFIKAGNEVRKFVKE